MADYPQLVQNISCSLPIFGFPGLALSLVIPRNTWPGMTESTLPDTILFFEPSTLEVNITDGSVSRAEPSTLDTEIVEGSITKNWTIHDNAPYRGWSMMSRWTFRAGKRYRGRFHFPRPNHPRQAPFITDGSMVSIWTFHAGGQYHGRFNLQSGTFHAGHRNRGWFHHKRPNHPR